MSDFKGFNVKESENFFFNQGPVNNHILSLKLSNFRNYLSYAADFPKCPIAFIGKNGVEKIENINLDEKEKKEFMNSIDAVKKLWKAASAIDPNLSKKWTSMSTKQNRF